MNPKPAPKGWIYKSRIPEWISREQKRSTSDAFWNETIDRGRLEIRRIGRLTIVSERSLRRYLGIESTARLSKRRP